MKIRILVQNQDFFLSLGIEQPNNTLYFGIARQGIGTFVGKAPLNQQGPPNLTFIAVNNPTPSPMNTIAVTEDKIFWNGGALSEIATHKKDGTGTTQVIFPGTFFWDNFCLDAGTKKIYGFTAALNGIGIYNADGTGTAEKINTNAPFETGHLMVALEY